MLPALLFASLVAAQSQTPPAAPPPAAPQAAAPVMWQGDWPYRPTGDDYPVGALRNQEQGTTRYRIEIGADGRASSCTITSSSGSSALDAATCRIIRYRTRFRPATDRQGHPIADTRESYIIWRLPPAEE